LCFAKGWRFLVWARAMDGYFPLVDYSNEVLAKDQILSNLEVIPSLVHPRHKVHMLGLVLLEVSKIQTDPYSPFLKKWLPT